jgi:hypothetical protein
VLIGDGWEKDGDFNTTFSKTVSRCRATTAPTTTPFRMANWKTILFIAGIPWTADVSHAIHLARRFPAGLK